MRLALSGAKPRPAQPAAAAAANGKAPALVSQGRIKMTPFEHAWNDAFRQALIAAVRPEQVSDVKRCIDFYEAAMSKKDDVATQRALDDIGRLIGTDRLQELRDAATETAKARGATARHWANTLRGGALDELLINRQVRLIGLTKSSELNGREGKIVKFSEDFPGRYQVKLPDEDLRDADGNKRRVAVKPSNFEVLPVLFGQADAAAPAPAGASERPMGYVPKPLPSPPTGGFTPARASELNEGDVAFVHSSAWEDEANKGSEAAGFYLGLVSEKYSNGGAKIFFEDDTEADFYDAEGDEIRRASDADAILAKGPESLSTILWRAPGTKSGLTCVYPTGSGFEVKVGKKSLGKYDTAVKAGLAYRAYVRRAPTEEHNNALKRKRTEEA